MTKMNALWTRFAMSALVLVGGGCLGSVADIRHHHYTLSAPPLAQTAHGDPAHTALVRVPDLQVDSLYDRAALVVRRSPTEVRFWQNDVWAVRPGRMLADALAHALQQSHVATSVMRELAELRPTHLLSGEVTALEIEQTGPTAMAHLGWILQLTHTETGEIIWQDTFDGRTEVVTRPRARGPAVVGLEALVNQALQQAVAGVGAALAKPVVFAVPPVDSP
jgi:ABC-type uncharacterized transport system auxiliary subunit